MELRDFFTIFIVHKKIFWGIISIFLFFGVGFYFLQTQTYKTSLTLNITRNSSVQSNEYAYDDFYRLQADERFADTVVRWIQAPHIVDAVIKNISSIDNQKFNAKRLSSQVISVEFVTNTKKDGEIISTNLVKVLNNESQRLNVLQKQNNWFIILGSKPIIKSNTMSLFFLLSLNAFIGFFIAFWIVMIIHYMTASSK
jgi:uncharacterized protein involved in exopolysaccharide biosynthesis